MTVELKIRVAVPDDVHEIMDLALSACDENGFVDPNRKNFWLKFGRLFIEIMA